MPAEPWALVVAFLVTALAAAVQGVVGLGLAVVSVPVLSLVDPDLAPVPQLLISLPLTLSMSWRERHHLDLSGVGWILLGRLPGAALGVALLKAATDRTLDLLIAAAVLTAVIATEAGVRIRRNAVTKFAVGIFSGISALIASIGGPPVALLYRDAKGGTIRSSLAVVFSFGVTITIIARTLAGEITLDDVKVAAVILPALVVGFLASSRIKDRIADRVLRIGISLVSSAAALGLAIRALSG